MGKKLGFVTPSLYQNQPDFNDITTGGNGYYNAAPGPDPCTGIGSPIGNKLAALFAKLSPQALIVLSHVGFWTHSALVLLFLNLLPHSKHFHVITASPNVFFRSLSPAGRHDTTRRT